MKGFITLDYKARFSEAAAAIAQWVRAGSIRYLEDVLDGLEAAPASIQQLYAGNNMGKLLIRLPAAYAMDPNRSETAAA
jgi:NADPH-dependent curcumin reductase CurA